jgi:hypothetical protein
MDRLDRFGGKTKNALVYSLPPNQLILPNHVDTVRYNMEIVPTHGMANLDSIYVADGGVE